MTKRPPTRAERDHMAAVAVQPCITCGGRYEELHHVGDLRLGCGMGLKSCTFCHVLPLYLSCHRKFHHIGKRPWEAKYG